MEQGIKRRLAAIMAADIAGYSRLMGEDEAATVRDLKSHQAEVLPLVADFGGRVIDVAGDGILAEFQSAVAAVECAVQIQARMSRRNLGVPEARCMRFRIGINLGEVVHDDARVYGDGINIAARLENLAAPGGISVSGKVREEVEGKLTLAFNDLGLQALKNIAKPVQVYALATVADGTPLPQPVIVGTPALQSPRRRWMMAGVALAVLVTGGVVATRMATVGPSNAITSVVVLPFENATGDTAVNFLSDGISESLINKLSGLDGLRVISRFSAFKFRAKDQKLDAAAFARELGVDAVVVGKVVLRGTALSISAEMVKVRDSAQLWGDKYSRSSDEMLQVEGEIATAIAQALSRRLSGEERARLTRTATTNPEAYRLYLKGREYLIGNQREMDKGVELLQQAVVLAPDYALAHAGLAEVYASQAYLRASSKAESAGKARAAATRAIALDPTLAEAHVALGLVRFYFDWDWAGAEAAFQQAVKLNPASVAARVNYATYLFAMARFDESLAQSAAAAKLDPLSMRPVHDMGIAHLFNGELDQAEAKFRQGMAINPRWIWGPTKLGRTLAMQDKCGDALLQAETVERAIVGGATPLNDSWLGITYALCKQPALAQRKIAELRELEKTQYVDPADFAQIHSALGDIDLAVQLWEKAFEDHSPLMVYALLVKREPQLRDHPRMKALIERMRFPSPGG